MITGEKFSGKKRRQLISSNNHANIFVNGFSYKQANATFKEENSTYEMYLA